MTDVLVDCDAHLITEDYLSSLKDTDLVQNVLNHYKITGNLTTLQKHKEQAISLGVSHQVVNFFGSASGLNYHHSKAQGRDIMTAYNDWITAIIDQGNGFFSGTGWLALQDIDSSLKEIQRCKKNNLFAVFIDDTITWGRAPWTKEIFAECNRLNMPVYIHFTKFDHYLDNALGVINDKDLIEKINLHPWNTQCKLGEIRPFLSTFYSLFESGWLDDYTDLKIIVAERGLDWIQQFVEFTDKHLNINTLEKIKKHCWFTTEPEDQNFVEDAEYVGWDRLLFASDQGHNADCGGANFGKDLDTIKSLNLSEDNFDLLTHKNFLKIKHG